MKKTHIFVVLLASLLVSCIGEKKTVERTVVKNTGDWTYNPNNPDGTATPTPTATSSGNEDYISIDDIVVHGKPSGTIVWNSSIPSHTGGLDPRVFNTDQKLYIQIIPRRDAKFATSINGDMNANPNCHYETREYTKLKMKINVASEDYPNSIKTCRFSANVDTPSNVIQLAVPAGSQYPPLITISNVETDSACLEYCQGNSQCISTYKYCQNNQFYEAGNNDCVGFDIRVATDETDPLPGTVKNCGDL